MNIIFGKENIKQDNKYIVLELDTIRFQPTNKTVTAYCVVEQVPILDMPKVDSMRSLHENLLINYRKRDWNFCEQALEHLQGFWGTELDTYYSDLRTRIETYQKQEPEGEWDGCIEKSLSVT